MIKVAAQLLVLGSGTSSGVPLIGCGCSVCTSSDPRDTRTRTSALLTCDNSALLFDTATDMRQQVLREGITSIDAVLYTHTHADHVNGIDDLRAFNNKMRRAIPVYGDSPTISAIRQNFAYIFDPVGTGYRPDLEIHMVDGSFDVRGLLITPIPLEHGPSQSMGYRSGNFAYLTDCSGIPDESVLLLKGVDIMVIDGLRYKSHPSHFTIAEAVAAAKGCGAKRIILTHLTHDIEHAAHSEKLPDGVEFAYDGQQIDVIVEKTEEIQTG